MLLWIAGVVPVAYVTGLPSFAFLLAILGFFWLQFELEGFGRYSDGLAVWFPIALGFFLSGISVWHSGRFENFSKTFARIGLFFVFS